jgi:serpin B
MKNSLIVSLGLLMATSVLLAGEPAKETDKLLFPENNNRFAVDLYKKLQKKDVNLIFSPYSISTAFGFVYTGAKSGTAEQIASTFYFETNACNTADQFARVQSVINDIEKESGINLHSVNGLWIQKNYHILQSFMSAATEDYEASVSHVDFKKDCEKVRLNINQWVEKNTQSKIKNLIAPGMLDSLTRMVLVNAIYFKAKWMHQFKEKSTVKAPFYKSNGKQVEAQMMKQNESFNYKEIDDLQVVELPYENRRISMFIFLPKQSHSLTDVEASLDYNDLQQFTRNMNREQVLLWLPKFKIELSVSLNKMLSSMGMPSAFGGNADFSGIDGTTLLYITEAVHKAYIDVDEYGTEAAAATAVVCGLKAAPPFGKPKVFKADHPFLFIIKENTTGSILFMGRVVNPSAGI